MISNRLALLSEDDDNHNEKEDGTLNRKPLNLREPNLNKLAKKRIQLVGNYHVVPIRKGILQAIVQSRTGAR